MATRTPVMVGRRKRPQPPAISGGVPGSYSDKDGNFAWLVQWLLFHFVDCLHVVHGRFGIIQTGPAHCGSSQEAVLRPPKMHTELM